MLEPSSQPNSGLFSSLWNKSCFHHFSSSSNSQPWSQLYFLCICFSVFWASPVNGVRPWIIPCGWLPFIEASGLPMWFLSALAASFNDAKRFHAVDKPTSMCLCIRSTFLWFPLFGFGERRCLCGFCGFVSVFLLMRRSWIMGDLG